MQHTIASALGTIVHTRVYPHSTITINLHVLAQDGSLLAALINASTLALIDAGIPMTDYLVACTAGRTINQSASGQNKQTKSQIPGLASLVEDVDDPLLDLNRLEEQELPFLTVATVGALGDQVVVCLLETRMDVDGLEEMLNAGIGGCRKVKEVLDRAVRAHGVRMAEDG